MNNDFPSRSENDLRAIIDGDESKLSIPPRSRIEKLLIELYEKGGGGGGSLPDPTGDRQVLVGNKAQQKFEFLKKEFIESETVEGMCVIQLGDFGNPEEPTYFYMYVNGYSWYAETISLIDTNSMSCLVYSPTGGIAMVGGSLTFPVKKDTWYRSNADGTVVVELENQEFVFDVETYPIVQYMNQVAGTAGEFDIANLVNSYKKEGEDSISFRNLEVEDLPKEMEGGFGYETVTVEKIKGAPLIDYPPSGGSLETAIRESLQFDECPIASGVSYNAYTEDHETFVGELAFTEEYEEGFLNYNYYHEDSDGRVLNIMVIPKELCAAFGIDIEKNWVMVVLGTNYGSGHYLQIEGVELPEAEIKSTSTSPINLKFMPTEMNGGYGYEKESVTSITELRSDPDRERLEVLENVMEKISDEPIPLSKFDGAIVSLDGEQVPVKTFDSTEDALEYIETHPDDFIVPGMPNYPPDGLDLVGISSVLVYLYVPEDGEYRMEGLTFHDETVSLKKGAWVGFTGIDSCTLANPIEIKSTVVSKIEDKFLPSSVVRNVHLYCDGSDIYDFNDKTTPLTFEQVKAIIADDKNNVFCTNGYYSLHSKYWYQPAIIGTDKEAVGFIGDCMLNGEPYMWRIVINEDNDVKEDEIWLGKHSDYAALEARVAALEAK